MTNNYFRNRRLMISTLMGSIYLILGLMIMRQCALIAIIFFVQFVSYLVLIFNTPPANRITFTQSSCLYK